jgi:adenylosuccinate synthase
MRAMIVAALCACLIGEAVLTGGLADGSEPASDDRSFSEKVGGTAKKIGKKIEEGFTKTAKKLEDKHVPEKVEQKLKKAVDKTAEGFAKAERKIKDKLAD